MIVTAPAMNFSCRLVWPHLKADHPPHFPARSTLIHSNSILNGPAFLSLNMKPRALISSGFTAPASLTTRPNEVASNLSSGTLTSIH